jgi:ribosome-associated toxin RatA of RatAB toxin-antitoxin module
MRMTRRTLKHGVLLSILLGCCLAGASPTWEVVTETEGMQVERRLLPGTARYEVRVSTYAPFPPQVIFKTLWRHHEYTAFVPYLKHLTILTHAPDEKMIYEQITMPVVRDRDYTVRVTAAQDATSGRIQLLFVSAPEAGPPVQATFVRVTAIQGSWTLVPTHSGGSMVTYVVASDPGGALPAWLVQVAQRKAAPTLVKAILDRVKHNLPHDGG